MRRIMPQARAYGSIGPNLFMVWAKKTDVESVDAIFDRGLGICNGKEWPLSMVRCHDGHLVCLFNAAKYQIDSGIKSLRIGALGEPRLVQLGQESLETGVVLLKIVLGEKQYLSMMGPVTQSVFSAAESVHRPTPWEAYSTNERRWVARRLRAVKGKLAALIASLTLRDPGQPFATVPPGL